MSQNTKQYVPTELGEQPIGKLLAGYAIPAIIAMVASSVYNIVDSIFVGQGVGDIGISGMAVASPFMNLGAAFGAMIGVGASTVISVRLGQGKYDVAQNILGNTITLNVVMGLLLTVICLVFLDDILYIFGASEQTIPYARDYMRIILIGNVVTHCYFGLNAILRSAGHPQLAMNCTFIAIGANVILDPIFIFKFQWGIQGAAWATILSQVIALCIQAYLFSRPTELLHFRRGIYRLKADIVRQCFAIGMSPFLMNACACLVVLLFNRRLLDFGGDMAIGAYGIVNRVVFIFVTIVFGLVQGMQPIVGYNWGARQDHRVWAVLRLTIFWATMVTLTAMVIGVFFPASVIHVFGAGEELTEKAVRAFRFTVAMFPLVGAQIVIGNFFQSIGHAAKSIFLSVTRQMIFLVPLLFFLPRWWDLDGVWLSMPISDAISFFTACGMMWYMMKKLKRRENIHLTEQVSAH
ncbi:MAG: MATE family efflux transporter [Paraprevotella sp.]|nr:MATE family efflux transporter [Paraprevotella sp.]MDY5265985.1 MATE family efflux transporter [Bacteroidaceae bacterium]